MCVCEGRTDRKEGGEVKRVLDRAWIPPRTDSRLRTANPPFGPGVPRPTAFERSTEERGSSPERAAGFPLVFGFGICFFSAAPTYADKCCLGNVHTSKSRLLSALDSVHVSGTHAGHSGRSQSRWPALDGCVAGRRSLLQQRG